MTETKRKRRLSKGRLIRWIGTLVSMALFIWLLARQDWARIYQNLTHTPIWLLPLVFVLYFLGMMLNTWRWSNLLRAQGIKIPYFEVLKMVLTGAFASNFLPSTIGGDMVRMVSLTRFEATWTLSVASVVMDRLLNVLAMLTILPFSVLVFGDLGTFFQKIRGLASAPVAWAGVGLTNRWTEKWLSKLITFGQRLRQILGTWMHHPRALLGSFMLAWLSSFVVFIAIFILARGLGISISLYQVMGVMALSYAVTLLPISINGYGVREIALTTLYTHIGATLEQAVTLAVVTRFILLLEALPGAIWLPSSIPTGKNGEKAR